MKKRTFALLLMLVCACFAGVPAWAATGTVMKFAGTAAADPNNGEYVAMMKFKEFVEKYSAGEITVEVYPANQLGSYVEFIEGTSIGTIESCVTGYDALNNLGETSMSVFAMPYLFEDLSHMRSVLENENDASAAIAKSVENCDMLVAGILYRPMRVLGNTQKPVKSPADAKGLTVRSPESPVNMSVIEAMGALPVTITWAEVFTSLSQGACNGVENAITELASVNLQEALKFVSETNHMAAAMPIFVNKTWFDQLSESQKDAVMKAGKDVTEFRAAAVTQEAEDAGKKFADAGVQVLRRGDIDFAAFEEACKDVYKKFVADGWFTEEFYNMIKNARP